MTSSFYAMLGRSLLLQCQRLCEISRQIWTLVCLRATNATAMLRPMGLCGLTLAGRIGLGKQSAASLCVAGALRRMWTSMSTRCAHMAALPRRTGPRGPAWGTGRASRTTTPSCPSRAASTAGTAPCAACGCACLPAFRSHRLADSPDHSLHSLCNPCFGTHVCTLWHTLCVSSSLTTHCLSMLSSPLALVVTKSVLN